VHKESFGSSAQGREAIQSRFIVIKSTGRLDDMSTSAETHFATGSVSYLIRQAGRENVRFSVRITSTVGRRTSGSWLGWTGIHGEKDSAD
jgi:hypothetical protein